eukprot:TRINITY_DN50485_c0_g1_i1.p2 TRINITY_DN50485_c0_g1~~TRINITY_DN50485_c0_g1_i1.p2  ORF type:complete len:207 (+),score=57.83 TRINITY_DN50485_c0_g1_i1:66-623(+)
MGEAAAQLPPHLQRLSDCGTGAVVVSAMSSLPAPLAASSTLAPDRAPGVLWRNRSHSGQPLSPPPPARQVEIGGALAEQLNLAAQLAARGLITEAELVEQRRRLFAAAAGDRGGTAAPLTEQERNFAFVAAAEQQLRAQERATTLVAARASKAVANSALESIRKGRPPQAGAGPCSADKGAAGQA